MTVPVKQPAAVPGDIMEQVLLKGDIGKLTPAERVSYYDAVCRSMGLNPYTKPFEFIVLNGRMQLYALRNCTDQLRKINAVSLEIISKEITDDIMTVHVRAKMPDGRVDEDLGAVAYPATLKGEARANAELKCITKAKRRATLSICGLSFLDETEVEDIPANGKRENPHITRPEDVAALTPEQAAMAPDLPKGEPRKKGDIVEKQRPFFEEAEQAMLKMESRSSLEAWADTYKHKLMRLSSNWWQMFEGRFKEHWLSLPEETDGEQEEADAFIAARAEDYPPREPDQRT